MALEAWLGVSLAVWPGAVSLVVSWAAALEDWSKVSWAGWLGAWLVIALEAWSGVSFTT